MSENTTIQQHSTAVSCIWEPQMHCTAAPSLFVAKALRYTQTRNNEGNTMFGP